MGSAVAARLDTIRDGGAIKAREIAQLLDTTPQTVSRWRTGKAEPQPDRLQRLLTLEWLIGQVREFYPEPDEARLWLFSPHRLLGGERPADRIQQGRTDDVLALIAQLRDGAFVQAASSGGAAVIYPPELLDRLQAIVPAPCERTAFRHMLAGRPPEGENTRGARWNPSGTAAIYLSTTRDGALAEAEYHLSLQHPRPRVRRTLYEIELTLDSVVDLSAPGLLAELGVGSVELADVTMEACRAVGGAAASLERDGICVPSARSSALNLVVFPSNRSPAARFEVRGEEEIPL